MYMSYVVGWAQSVKTCMCRVGTQLVNCTPVWVSLPDCWHLHLLGAPSAMVAMLFFALVTGMLARRMLL